MLHVIIGGIVGGAILEEALGNPVKKAVNWLFMSKEEREERAAEKAEVDEAKAAERVVLARKKLAKTRETRAASKKTAKAKV